MPTRWINVAVADGPGAHREIYLDGEHVSIPVCGSGLGGSVWLTLAELRAILKRVDLPEEEPTRNEQVFALADNRCEPCPFFRVAGTPWCRATKSYIDTYPLAPDTCPAIDGVLVRRIPE